MHLVLTSLVLRLLGILPLCSSLSLNFLAGLLSLSLILQATTREGRKTVTGNSMPCRSFQSVHARRSPIEHLARHDLSPRIEAKTMREADSSGLTLRQCAR